MGKKRERNSANAAEKITGDRMENGTMQYKVKWSGKTEETWEDEDKLECEDLIQKYLETKEDAEDGSGGEEEEEEEEEEAPTPAKKKKQSTDSADEDEPDEEFEVESIVADRTTDDGKVQYKVHWRGYESDQDTWENESNLDCPEIIEEYNANKGGGGAATNNKGGKKGGGKGKGAGAKGGKGEGKAKKGAPPVGEREPEKIVGLHTLKNGKRELLVRWKNLPESEDSWEPEESMLNTPVHEKFLIKEKENKAKKEAKLKEMAPEE